MLLPESKRKKTIGVKEIEAVVASSRMDWQGCGRSLRKNFGSGHSRINRLFGQTGGAYEIT